MLLLLLFCASEIEGQVKRAGTREVVSRANIAVLRHTETLTAETDDDGRFEIKGLDAGEVEVVVAHGAFLRTTQKVTLKDGEKTKLTFFLREPEGDAFGTLVIGRRDRTQISQVTLTRPEITRSPGSFGDPLRAVQNMPGVARAPLFLGTINMRGTLARDSAIMLENMPMPQLYHMGIGPAVLPDMLIEDINFVPGAFGPSYGRSTAGIVDVHLREPTFERVRGRASVDLLMAAALVEIPVGKRTTITIGARRSYLDALVAPFAAAANATLPLPQFTDYQARLVHDWDNGRADVLFFGSFDNMTFVGRNTEGLPKPQWSFQALRPSITTRGANYTNRISAFGVYIDNYIQQPTFDYDFEKMESKPGLPLLNRNVGWQGYVRDDLRLTFSEPEIAANTGPAASAVDMNAWLGLMRGASNIAFQICMRLRRAATA